MSTNSTLLSSESESELNGGGGESLSKLTLVTLIWEAGVLCSGECKAITPGEFWLLSLKGFDKRIARASAAGGLMTKPETQNSKKKDTMKMLSRSLLLMTGPLILCVYQCYRSNCDDACALGARQGATLRLPRSPIGRFVYGQYTRTDTDTDTIVIVVAISSDRF